MKAVTFTEYGEPEVLHVADADEPQPGPGQVRIAVRAAGVNPIDWKARSGMMREVMPAAASRSSTAARRRASSTRSGRDVTDVAAGRRGLRLRRRRRRGRVGRARRLRAQARRASSWEEAAALPVAVETSVRVFNLLGGVGEGQTHRRSTARPAASASPPSSSRGPAARASSARRARRNHDFLRSLGAEPTTYGEGLVRARPRARARRRRPRVRHGRARAASPTSSRSPATRRASRRSPTSAPPRSA